MTSHFIHMSSLYYENPFKFDPDRWIRADLAGTRSKIDKYFVPFTRGSRACIGIK
jgi:cytochrome P450